MLLHAMQEGCAEESTSMEHLCAVVSPSAPLWLLSDPAAPLLSSMYVLC